MNFTIKELNELIYSLGITASKGIMCDKELNVSLLNKLYDELTNRIAEEAIDEEIEPEYDSAGFTEDDRIVNGQYRVISNEDADEDYRSTLKQDEQRYGDSHMLTSFPIAEPFKTEYKPKGITQAILDMVQRQGDATHTEMHNFYKRTFGSNSFSHILKSLIIPYKNRPTRRYLSKMANGNYEVRLANPSNWVVVENDFIKWIRSNTK